MAFEPLIGQIQPWPIFFAPRGWAFCNGQLLSIHQNTALFSLLGTQFGGDGRTTFGLPNLSGKFPSGASPTSGPGKTGGDSQVRAADAMVTLGNGPNAIASDTPDNRPPHIQLNYIIALQGIYPQRS